MEHPGEFAWRAGCVSGDLARPSTLALIAGTAGPAGFWLARQPQPQSTSAFDGAAAAKTTPVAGVMLAFIMRYGMQRLPMILQQVWAAWQKRASRIDPDMPKYPTTDFSATATRHGEFTDLFAHYAGLDYNELLPANAHNTMDTGARRSLRLHIQHQSTAEIGASISRPLLISNRVIKVWE